MHLIILQAAMAWAFIFLISLVIGLILGVPTFVYFAEKQNKNYNNYNNWERIGFTILMTIIGMFVVGGIILWLSSFIDLGIT
jgi:hypothetical protein